LMVLRLRPRRATRHVVLVSDELLSMLSDDVRRKVELGELTDDERLKLVLEHLYWRNNLSSTQIASLLGVDDRLVRRMMERLGIKRRERVEALKLRLTKYSKRGFTGSLIERIRLHTLIAADAHVRRHHAQIEVTTSTPNPWLISEIHFMLKPYSDHFNLNPFYNRRTGQFSWRLSILLDQSFDFLLRPVEVDVADDGQFWSFTASLLEGEASIEVVPYRGLAQVKVRVYNDDRRLMTLLHRGLLMRGLLAKMRLEKPRTTEEGVKFSHVVEVMDPHARRLLGRIAPDLIHFEKLLRAKAALKASERPWSEVEPLLREVERVVEAGLAASKRMAAEALARRAGRAVIGA